MASAPSLVDNAAFFYPFGDGPAVCLTQELPPSAGVAAEVLCLGCGDARNVLYTAYADQNSKRTLDFTCCDHETAIIARNILLFSMILDDHFGERSKSIWNIYYHFYLTFADYEVVHTQAIKLLQVSQTIGNWNSSLYGRVLRLGDENTLHSVRDLWQSYCILDDDRERNSQAQALAHRIQQAKQYAAAGLPAGTDLTLLRATAPAYVKAFSELSKLHNHFWHHGILDRDGRTIAMSRYANPLFASPLTHTSVFHHGTNPLVGYHLSLAYAQLRKGSPFQQDWNKMDDIPKLIQTAQSQFHTWSWAFRDRSSYICVRFFVQDALTACHLMQRRLLASIDEADEFCSGDAPRSFNIIDTSNLMDSLGSLNILLSATPLLQESSYATLYTETPVKQDEDAKDLTAHILRGDFPAMSLLLGLHPSEFWTNTTMLPPENTSVSLTIRKMQKASKHHHHSFGNYRILWKHAFLIPSLPVNNKIHISADALSRFLFNTYLNMFPDENISHAFSINFAGVDKPAAGSSLPRYHRGSLIALMSYLKKTLITDWSSVVSEFVRLVKEDLRLLFGKNFHQELLLHLHLHGLYSADVLLRPPNAPREFLKSLGIQGWTSLPSIVCLTLQVPKSRLKGIAEYTFQQNPGLSPLLYCAICTSNSTEHFFSATQLSFGQLQRQVYLNKNESELILHENSARWNGSSPLLISFLVPTWMLLQDPSRTKVVLKLQCTSQVAEAFTAKIGKELKVFETQLCDWSNVYLSKGPPISMSASKLENALAMTQLLPRYVHMNQRSKSSANGVSTSLTVHLDGYSRLAAFMATLKLQNGPALRALQENAKVFSSQLDRYTIQITIKASRQDYNFSTSFPVPITLTGNSTRIGRKAGHIEILSPVARPQTSQLRKDEYFRCFLDDNTPVFWNVSRLNLDIFPTLDRNNKLELPWLLPQVLSQLTEPERQIRDRYLRSSEVCPDTRLNFKSSIIDLFTHSPGLNSKETRVFALNLPSEGGVIGTLIFVSRLKLDTGNRTAVLDAAVLPLTPQITPLLSKFLKTMSIYNICRLNVDRAGLKAWHQMLPIFVERCRTWPHMPSCEYAKENKIPLSVELGKSPICSCGVGKCLPEPITTRHDPQWHLVKRFCTRAAISPIFPVPYAERIPGFTTGTASNGSGSGSTSRSGSGSRSGSMGKKEKESFFAFTKRKTL